MLLTITLGKLHAYIASMVDYLFTLGQAASVLLLLYGGFLVLLPARKKPARDAKLEDVRALHHA